MMKVFDEPLMAPRCFLSPEAHAALRQERQDLDCAKEVINGPLCHGSASLGHEGRRVLQSIWAYLHECFCAGGRRPNSRRIHVIREHAFDEYYFDPTFHPVPRGRKWARIRGVPVA